MLSNTAYCCVYRHRDDDGITSTTAWQLVLHELHVRRDEWLIVVFALNLLIPDVRQRTINDDGQFIIIVVLLLLLLLVVVGVLIL